MNILTDSSNNEIKLGRVLVKSNKGFGRYNDISNWIQVKKSKGEYFVSINKEKVNLNNLQQIEDYTWKHGTDKENNAIYKTVSQFYFEQ